MKIKVLPDHVINQISAGEVVERPASVVRELVDNSVDAGASDISVYIEAGGKSIIKVSDDGCGMSRDDALLAFERHATSKLSLAEDLLSVKTFGFRGEALPSIASVAKVSLKTKNNKEELCTEVIIDAGSIKTVRQVPGNQGSEMIVQNLFFNTPARRNFLKTNKTEELKIKQWIINFALVHPQIRFRLYIDQKEVINYPRRDSIAERAKSLFKGSTVDVDYSHGEFKINGLVAHPSLAKSDSNTFLIYINKRLVSDKMILRAVKEGFDSMLKDREFPLGFLSIQIPSELVDVNVHPQKSEVRFRRPQDVYIAVRNAVMNSVKNFKSPANVEKFSNASSFYTNTSSQIVKHVGESLAFQTQNYQQANFFRSEALDLESVFIPAEDNNMSPVNGFKYTELNFVGQIFSCYLLCTLDNKFYVIDMHAAHERCNYNNIRERINSTAQQILLVPIVIELNEVELNNCLEYSQVLSEYGFEVEAFSETALAVRKIPGIINQNSIQNLFIEISKADLPQQVEGKIKEKLDHIVARIACHASIRSGYKMKREEVYALFESMEKAETGAACPHGRPVAVQFTEDDIEKWFGRDR